MLRLASLAALLATLVVAVPSAAQVGSGKIAFSNRSGIYTANGDGTGLTRIRPGESVGNPHWSPDGSEVSFSSFDGSGTRVHVMNADGTGERVLASGGASLGPQPWSPDGTEIAYRLGNDLYVVSSAGGTPRRLTFDGDADGPAWSPVSAKLVYSRRLQNRRSELFVIDASGGMATQITQGGPDFVTWNEEPAWSPDGQVVAFIRDVDNQRSLNTVHSNGTEPHRVAGIVGRGYDAPAWSQDGAKIGFSTAVNARYSPYSNQGREIFVVNADGSGQRRLTELAPRGRTDSAPTWSPDGEQLLFSRYLDRVRPYTMNVDGTCEGKLAPVLEEGWSASWQPGSPAGAKHCHAVAVDASVGLDGQIEAIVTNEGTEALTEVVLHAEGANDVTLTYGAVEAARGTCSARSGSVTCRLPQLERGGRVRIGITAEARRVTRINDPKPAEDVGLTTPISVGASQSLLESGRESESLWYWLPSCTTRTPGAGTIRGTIYPDRLCGRSGADRIFPRGGSDVVQAGAGADDIVSAGDGRRDTISCGRGRDRVVADRGDRVSRDCERVRRR